MDLSSADENVRSTGADEHKLVLKRMNNFLTIG